MTPAQKEALIALRDHGGEGAISKHGQILAAGERLPFMPDTWLRLMTTGHVEPRGPMRIGLTREGVDEAVPVHRKVPPKLIAAPQGAKPAMEGAE